MYKLILASESPRRRELLNKAGFVFDVVSVKVSEIPNKNLNIKEQILDIARRKASTAFAQLKSSMKEPFIILSADTEVIYNQAPLGKPTDAQDAARILRLLSGKSHQVMTAICMIESNGQTESSHVETTNVIFKDLSDEEIFKYISTGEPMDKAGAYGIQGLGRAFVEKFDGSYDNVVGLPVNCVQELLQNKNWKVNLK